MSINLAFLYPDLLNLHGDRGNLSAFQMVASQLDLDLTITRIDDPQTKLDFDSYDIILVPPGETVEVGFIASVLADQKDGFQRYIAGGGIMVVIGTSIAIFGDQTTRRRTEAFRGIGLVDVNCTELRTACTNDAVLTTDSFGQPMEIVGGQVQMLRVNLGSSAGPLGLASYGYGNDGAGAEGLRLNNFIFTNLLGPVFIKNPWFAEAILRLACARRGIKINQDSPDYQLEKQANQAIKRFIAVKIEKHDKSRLYNGED